MEPHIRVHLINVAHVVETDVVESLIRPSRAIYLVPQQPEKLLNVISDLLIKTVLNLITFLPAQQIFSGILSEFIWWSTRLKLKNFSALLGMLFL